jgi:hypothetical protein
LKEVGCLLYQKEEKPPPVQHMIIYFGILILNLFTRHLIKKDAMATLEEKG